jgi:hypothetical protein
MEGDSHNKWISFWGAGQTVMQSCVNAEPGLCGGPLLLSRPVVIHAGWIAITKTAYNATAAIGFQDIC